MPRYKLGKGPPAWHPNTLMMSKYTRHHHHNELPPPERIYLEYKIANSQFGMFGNDRLGDCLAAYAAHHLMVITAHTGTIVIPDQAEVESFYSAFSGYDPSQTQPDGTNPTDVGGVFTDMYEVWRTRGLAGHKILAWAQIDTKDYAKRQIAIRLFLGVGVGVQLPFQAQAQFLAGKDWDPVPGDTIEGGHAIIETGEGARGHNLGSWGKGDQKATNAWDLTYTDEVYVPLTPGIISAANDVAPKALNYDALVADMKALSA